MNQMSLSHQDILEAVRDWSPEERFAIVEQILATLRYDYQTKSKPKTLHLALGLAATNKPTPTDEDVNRWLAERREERFIRNHLN